MISIFTSTMFHPVTDNKIFVVIPVYEDHATISSVVNSLTQSGFKNIIIVDDGSSADVRAAIDGLPVYYLRHSVNLGQGAALQTGFDFAKQFNPDILITIDADGQHDVNDLPSLINPLLENSADIVLGSRFLTRSKTSISSRRKGLLHIARFINYLFTGLWLTDAHNGARALNRFALTKIRLDENRMAHASEILFQIRKHNLRFLEIPVNVYYTDYSRRKGQKGMDSLGIFIDLVLHKLFR